jgi:hypothetical protein
VKGSRLGRLIVQSLYSRLYSRHSHSGKEEAEVGEGEEVEAGYAAAGDDPWAHLPLPRHPFRQLEQAARHQQALCLLRPHCPLALALGLGGL